MSKSHMERARERIARVRQENLEKRKLVPSAQPKRKVLEQRIVRLEARLAFAKLELANEDDVLAETYTLLRQGMTHAEAAAFASERLGKEYKPDAWRMKVTKYAKEHELPRIGQRAPKRSRRDM